jgi:E3 ubiquitin-protein ligase HUWE1
MHPANLMLSIMAGGIPLGGDGEEGDEEEFGDDVEEDGEPGQPSFAELLQSAADDDGEEDDEYDPSKDPDGGDDVEDEEMDAEDGDEVEDGMDTENQNSFASLLAQSLKLTDEEQDADDDYDPTRDQDDGNDDEDGMDVDDGAEVANGDDDNDDEPPELEGEMLELFQKEKQFRDHILGVVQNLSAVRDGTSNPIAIGG